MEENESTTPMIPPETLAKTSGEPPHVEEQTEKENRTPVEDAMPPPKIVVRHFK